MNKKTFVLLSLLIGLSFSASAQEEGATDNTIDFQIKDLIEKSSTYQTYKVIKTSELGILQRNIRDSISSLKAAISDSERVITEQNNQINNNTKELEALNLELEKSQKNVDNINFLWFATEKASYKFIMWSIVAVLLFISSFLFYRYKKTYSDTKEAIQRLDETESELESLRKRSLEREQKVRRELQDEINKNKNKTSK